MAGIKLQLGEDGYRLEVDEVVSEIVDYGEPLEMDTDDGRYLAFVDAGETGDAVESQLEHWVYKVEPCLEATTEEAEFGEEDDDEEEEEGEITIKETT